MWVLCWCTVVVSMAGPAVGLREMGVVGESVLGNTLLLSEYAICLERGHVKVVMLVGCDAACAVGRPWSWVGWSSIS